MNENPEVLRSFGRRKGRRLRTHAQELMDGLLPEIQITLDGDITVGKTTWLDIGFGGRAPGTHRVAAP
jgi:hypothetical protein